MTRSGHFLFGRHQLLFFFYNRKTPHFIQARAITDESRCKELSLAGLHGPVPFNSDALMDAPKRVVICEGCIDTLSAVQLGYDAVGVPGVAAFRDEWFALFRDVRLMTIVFDNDLAGRQHAIELRTRFRMRGIKAEARFPAVGKDVNDLLNSLLKEKRK